ncbi:hypothetical protein [Helicobacter sp. MIT 14-3879]|uniref:hypothetical protein n=1 Tax=Helicobacter sp. MIT 14-3879 TaxID=2040649 RepID=UPI000E1E79EF|nr:hypothetical protein [Helicobacter sp. MIT 14-3879]RDU61193.1 hypothetical protein CQA44_09840 [Helicobacter sp. MIT 14-3879]
MPIKTTNLSYEGFNNRLLSLLKLVEGIKTKIYADNADTPKITIGIGFNIEVDKWREVILMYKVSILKYADLENGVYTLANILSKQRDSTQALINTTSKEIKDKINEYRVSNKIQKNTYQTGKNPNQNMINLQKDLNIILQNNIKIYNQNPDINQKLDINMIFELTDDEAIEVKNIISFSEIKALRHKLNKWNANYLTSFSKTELANPQEFIPLLSIYYQRPARFNPESGLILLQKALKDKNRFLAWFSVRYYADIRQFKNPYYSRRIQEAAMFGLGNKDQNNNIEYFSTSLDIFSYLNFNFKEANTEQGLKLLDKYTYLSFMQTYEKCKEVDEKAKNLLREYNTYHTKDKHYYSYVAKEEFQGIADILSPYLSYLNTLTQKNFSLDNIYCIANYCENLGANKLDNVALLNKTLSQKFEKLEANTFYNILILYPNPTPSIIQIEQPKNTFITLLAGTKAKIDCSKLIEDQCELIYLKYDPTQEEQQTSNPQAFSCSAKEELILTRENETHFKAVKNNISYFINKNDGILKIALANNEENAIELYSFAKENQFKILQDKASKMLKIHLKLERYSEEILSYRGGNFELTLNNLNILDENGNNHETITKVFLHNCENRRIYESLELSHTEGIYKSSFKIDLILDKNSSFFKRATKCIIATKALKDFSTGQMHQIGNVAIVSLSSADKQGGYYTFTNKVSMQDFGENLYLDIGSNGYEKQIKNSRENLYITNLQAYKEKEQQNTTDKIPCNETIFIRAYLNNEEKFFFDETIKWAYCIKKEEDTENNSFKINTLENLQGNDITFNTSMLLQSDRNKFYNMNEKYQLILFAYFNKPAFKTTHGVTHIVLK